MNSLQAQQIDTQYPLLPGSQGEHDFFASDCFADIYQCLNRFAEMCGGLALDDGSSIELMCSTGLWRLYFRSRTCKHQLYAVTYCNGSIEQDYWRCDRTRNFVGGYQVGNAQLPLLQLSD